MRSAGSTINDIADRNFDAHVERTRLRPLACGAINAKQALIFLGIELTLAAALLSFLSPLTRLVAVTVVPLVFVYPFCKRVTYWPQAVLGAAFNWGMLMAWTEVTGHTPIGAVLMWLGAASWQIGYDTIYGYVDARDDERLGLRSTALLFATRGKTMIGLFYSLAVTAWSIGGWLIGMSALYQTGIFLIGIHLAWQLKRFDLQRPQVNFQTFLANIATGVALAVASLADYIFR